jgi:hypothetical protein
MKVSGGLLRRRTVKARSREAQATDEDLPKSGASVLEGFDEEQGSGSHSSHQYSSRIRSHPISIEELKVV